MDVYVNCLESSLETLNRMYDGLMARMKLVVLPHVTGSSLLRHEKIFTDISKEEYRKISSELGEIYQVVHHLFGYLKFQELSNDHMERVRIANQNYDFLKFEDLNIV